MATSLPGPITGFALDVVAWLVTYALHSTVLLGAALMAFAAVTWLARRSGTVADAAPALRECVGKVALLAGVVTASLQLGLGIEPFGLRPALIETRAAPVEVAATPAPASVAPERLVSAAISPAPQPAMPARVSAALPTVPIYLLPVTALLETALRAVNAPSEPPPQVATPVDTQDVVPGTLPDEAQSAFPVWIAAFLALWAFVSGTALVRRLVGCHALGLSLAGREPIRSGLAREIFDDLCARAGLTGVELSVAPGLAAPITRGIVRREVCLNPRALTDLSHDELAALLGHEVAHASRRDPAWLAVFRCFEIVFCLQPLNRVVARRLEDDAELLCDDRSVVWTGDRLPLASCLTEVAGWLVPAGRSPRLAVGMATHGARLTRRVERLVDEQHQPDAGRRRPIPTLCAASVAAAVVVLVPGFAAERAERPLPLALRLELAALGAPADESETDERASDAPAPAETVTETAGNQGTAQPDARPVGDAQSIDTMQLDAAAWSPTTSQVDASAMPVVSTPPDCSVVIGAIAEGTTPDPVANVELLTNAVAPDPIAVRRADTSLGDALDALEAEIDLLREQLSTREGGEALAPGLDALTQRARQLRQREHDLLRRFAQPSNTLLSPDESNRTAEVR